MGEARRREAPSPAVTPIAAAAATGAGRIAPSATTACWPAERTWRREGVGFFARREASEKDAIDAPLRREGDRPGRPEVRRQFLEQPAGRRLLRERRGLDGETGDGRGGRSRAEDDGAGDELRAPRGDQDPGLARRSVRELRQVALQSHAVEDSARRGTVGDRNRRRGAAPRAALRGGSGRRGRDVPGPRLRRRTARASQERAQGERESEAEQGDGPAAGRVSPSQNRDRTWVPRTSLR